MAEAQAQFCWNVVESGGREHKMNTIVMGFAWIDRFLPESFGFGLA